jgi:hypothetical protein
MPNKDLDRFQRDITSAVRALPSFLARAATNSLLLLESDLKEYPPQPPRDRGVRFNTYVRGIGHFPKSYFTGGGAGSGQVRYTSEKLGASYGHRVRTGARGAEGELTNPVSYQEFVQGEHQQDYHDETGWETVEEVMAKHKDEIDREIDQAMEMFLRSLGR